MKMLLIVTLLSYYIKFKLGDNKFNAALRIVYIYIHV